MIHKFFIFYFHFFISYVITRVYLADNGANALFFRKYQID
jgi:hypothetical protein